MLRKIRKLQNVVQSGILPNLEFLNIAVIDVLELLWNEDNKKSR